MNCTFFGHADAPDEIEKKLEEVIKNLIKSGKADTFYVGTHGSFDKMAYKTVLKLSKEYPIKIYAVLSAIPVKKTEAYKETIVPEGLENVPPKFGIEYRNKWMIERSDYVVTYVNRSFGGAAKFKALAERRGKKVINIG